MNCDTTESFLVQNNLCFTCSKDSVPEEIATVILQCQGLVNSPEERQAILQVICQLLRVQWESVSEVMTLDNGSVPFCPTCLSTFIAIILLREKLFKIESEIRNEVKMIEECVAMTWTESGHLLEESESSPGMSDDVRTTFRRQVMQEILNKKLLEQKVTELHQTSNKFSIEVEPSMVQLNFGKNVFEISGPSRKDELIDMTPSAKIKIDLDYDDDDDEKSLPVQLTMTSTTSDRDTYAEFTLIPVSPCLSDSDTEPCPRKKAKSSAESTTTDTIQDIAEEQPSYISSSSISTLDKSEAFPLSDKMSTVKSTTSVKPPNRATKILNPKSSKSPTKRQRAKRTTVSLPKTNKKKKQKSPLKSKNKSIISNFIETEFDATEGNDFEEMIDRNEMISEDSDINSDDSEGSTNEEEDEICNDSDIEKEEKLEKANEEKSKPMDSMSVDSTSCSRQQLFKPKFSRTSKPKKEQNFIKLEQAEATFIAKDKSIWTTIEPINQPETVRSYEVLRENGGLIGPAQNTKLTPTEIFKLMFPPSIVEKIVKYTNKHAEHAESKKTQPPNPNVSIWYPVTVDEIYAYIGILLLLGVEKKRNFLLSEVWTTDERYCYPTIVATMSRDRFRRIQSHLRFDDTQARKSGPITESQNDINSKRSYISELLDPFVEVMQSHLRPYDTLVLDEMLVKFRGHSKFRVYMKSKPGKYGMKFWALCDVETGYILNISLYHGKVGDTVAKELGKTVVLDLVKNYFNSGRAVTMDNFFTSKALGEELIKHKMSMLGTLNRNRMDVIPEFNDPKGRDVESSIIAFQGDFTMVSYIQRKNRAAILLSTQHHSAEICPGTKNKPRMILDYNATKGGVDTADQMIANCSCQRSTRRWPVKVFYALLDIAAFNAYAVHQLHTSLNKQKVVGDKRSFLRNISENLMEPLITTRLEGFTTRNVRPAGPLYRAFLRIGYEEKSKHPVTDLVQRSKGTCLKCHSLVNTTPVPPILPSSAQASAKCGLCRDIGVRPKEQKKANNRCCVCKRWICGTHSARKYWCIVDGIVCHQITEEH